MPIHNPQTSVVPKTSNIVWMHTSDGFFHINQDPIRALKQ